MAGQKSIEELKLELALARLRNKQDAERMKLENELASEQGIGSSCDEPISAKKKRTWYEWLLNIEVER